MTLSTVNLFWVMVPVLSLHKTSTPAISSIATSLLTIASFLARAIAPMAMVTDSTAGRATGIEAIVRTRANCNVSRRLSWRRMAAMKTIATSAAAIAMR